MYVNLYVNMYICNYVCKSVIVYGQCALIYAVAVYAPLCSTHCYFTLTNVIRFTMHN